MSFNKSPFAVVLVSLALAAQTAMAASFAPIKSFKSASLQGVSSVARQFGDGSSTVAVQVARTSDSQGRSAQQVRIDTIKQAIHKYFGADLTDGIDLSRIPAGTRGVAKMMSVLSTSGNDQSDLLAQLKEELMATQDDSAVELYAGTGAGNNTLAELIALYDNETDQILIFGFSNFGSDN